MSYQEDLDKIANAVLNYNKIHGGIYPYNLKKAIVLQLGVSEKKARVMLEALMSSNILVNHEGQGYFLFHKDYKV